MNSSGPAPQAQNPQQTAQQQTQSNVQTAIANATLGNTNQVTPQGTLTYSQTGGQQVGDNFVPQYTATQKLSPEQQQIYDKTTGLQSGALDTAGQLLPKVTSAINTPLDFSKLAAMPGDQTAAKDQAYSALTARSTQALDLEQQHQATQLVNQGIQPGTEAWDNAMRPIQQSRVDASNQGTINAGTIAGQDIAQALQLRDQGINEQQTIRNQPLQDYSTILGLGGGVQQPNYAPPSQGTVMPTDVAGINSNAYQQQLQQYQIGQQSNNATMGGLFGLGGAALGAAARVAPFFMGSDIRMKENVRHIGHTNDGQRLYSFNYIGDRRPQIGLMAQEVEQIKPDAVVEFEGFKYVDYARALADAST